MIVFPVCIVPGPACFYLYLGWCECVLIPAGHELEQHQPDSLEPQLRGYTLDTGYLPSCRQLVQAVTAPVTSVSWNIRPLVQLGHRLQSALCIAQSVSPVHSGCRGQCTSFPLQCFIAHFTSGPEVYEYGLQVRCEVEGGHSWLSGDIIDNCGHFVDICHATRWHVTRRRCPHRIYTTYSP